MSRFVRHKNCVIEFDDNDNIISINREKQVEEENLEKVCDEKDDNYSEEICDDEDDYNFSNSRFIPPTLKDVVLAIFIILCLCFISTLIIKSCSGISTSDISESIATTTVATTTTSSSQVTTTTSVQTTTTTETTSTSIKATTTTKSDSGNNILSLRKESFDFLSGVIFFEQGDYSREGQIAVGHIILNRLKNDYTEERLLNVLTSGAFSSVSTKSYRWEGDGIYSNILQSFSYNGSIYYTKKPTKQSLEVAQLLLAGKTENPIGSRDSFREKNYYLERADTDFKYVTDAIPIGDNIFFTYKSKPDK